jgi:hypothetical protein
MPNPRLLSALRDHLVTQGVVRKPSVPGSLPPMWVEPTLGTPAPGEGNDPVAIGADLVLGAYLTGGFAPPAYSTLRKPIVDIRIRSAKDMAYLAEDVELAITPLIRNQRDWTMGGLYVVESEQHRPLQRLGSDAQGYEHVVAYWFELPLP